jgi:NADPH:quinone reductase-like Zn-dependent oxidoreductase
MLAITLQTPSFRQPLSAIAVGEHDEPTPPDGWAIVTLRAASLNHHDLWSMQGVGVQESWLPCVLGSDGAGIDDEGNEVIIYPILADPRAGDGDEMLDPGRRMLSDGIDGTLAERVAVPRANLVAKPASLSWEAAACLPTAWLTAYRMLFVAADLRPGATVLVQGAGGGLATAIVALGRAAGLRVWVTSRSEERIAQAVALGADAGFASGARLPERVDAVIESVGKATWSHSVKSLRPGGKLVVAGATSGTDFDPEISRIFLNRVQVLGTSLGTPADLARLVAFCDHAGIAPTIDSTFPLAEAPEGLRRLHEGESFGKVVVLPS